MTPLDILLTCIVPGALIIAVIIIIRGAHTMLSMAGHTPGHKIKMTVDPKGVYTPIQRIDRLSAGYNYYPDWEFERLPEPEPECEIRILPPPEPMRLTDGRNE